MGSHDPTRFEGNRLTDGPVTVEVGQTRTPNGARLELSNPDTGRSIRLDPLELESLTWQGDRFFTDVLGSEPRPSIEQAEKAPSSDWLYEFRNEYAMVRIRFVDVQGSARLFIQSPKLGYSTHFGAADLASLLSREKTFFSALLRTPLGPENAS